MSELSKDDSHSSAIKLTETVKKGGCAAKLPAGELRKVLGRLQLKGHSNLKVGLETLDDAALWDLNDGRYLIQTLDFFTPIVDDAFEFGAIAATNALSDVYAMGGQPATAMSILAYPTSTLPMELLEPLMAGAISKIHEAGACLVGGHSIDDETLKLGFSVSGFVQKDRAWTNAGASPGDAIILTKALGTGTLMSALKSKKDQSDWTKAAIESMTTLNRLVDLVDGFSVNAATDITGFGLAGHLLQMGQASQVTIEVQLDQLPLLNGFRTCLEKLEIRNRAHTTNRVYAEAFSNISHLDPVQQAIVTDAQTSGGLALAVPKAQVKDVMEKLGERFGSSKVIGRVVQKSSHPLQFV